MRASAKPSSRFESRVVEQAREPLTGGLEVIKEAGGGGLAARLHDDERAHEIRDGLLLMPVCLGQDEADILAQASGSRALFHGRTNALTRVQLVTTHLLFQMCPDISFRS
jgi:hypothetical protein